MSSTILLAISITIQKRRNFFQENWVWNHFARILIWRETTSLSLGWTFLANLCWTTGIFSVFSWGGGPSLCGVGLGLGAMMCCCYHCHCVTWCLWRRDGSRRPCLCVGLLTTNSRPGAYRQDQSALSTGLVVMATGGPHYWYLVQSLGTSWQTDISQSYKLQVIATTVSLPAERWLMNVLKELRSCSTGYGLQLVAIVFNYWYLVVQRRYRYSAGWLYPTLTVNYFEINYSTSSDHKYYTTRCYTVILCGNQLSCPLRMYCSHKGTTRFSIRYI